jgi:hypothetical protein
MSLTLTPLQSDSFNRSNVSPLGSPWAVDENNDFAFQIVSDVCIPQSSNVITAQFYTYGSMPTDQYCSATLAAVIGASSFLDLKIRATDNGNPFTEISGYRLHVTAAGAWVIYRDLNFVSTSLASGSGLVISAGDVYTLAAVGTTLYAYQNGVLLGSVVDSNITAGKVMLGGEAVSATSALQISEFVLGSAAVASTSGLPFLGSVTVVAGIPAGENDVFQGTVKVLASAPPGENNPYLGHVNVLSAAPSGRWNPSLGQVVVLSSRPNDGAPDIWFGSVVES